MADYSLSKEAYVKGELTEKQQLVLDTVWDFAGDVIAAARAAGYSNPYAAVDALAPELNEMAEKALARLSLKSVATMERVLDSDGDVKQANEKLKAVQMILDRTNPKIEKSEIKVEGKGGVFILPEKRAVEEPEDGES
jgi:hypothetical protein